MFSTIAYRNEIQILATFRNAASCFLGTRPRRTNAETCTSCVMQLDSFSGQVSEFRGGGETDFMQRGWKKSSVTLVQGSECNVSIQRGHRIAIYTSYRQIVSFSNYIYDILEIEIPFIFR